MRIKKFYTVKQWNCFKDNDYFDMQDMLCQRYDVILTDHKTKKESIDWINFCNSLTDKIFQPTIEPLKKNVNTFF